MLTGPKVFQASQTMTKTVRYTRKRGVPRKRAMPSEILPNLSALRGDVGRVLNSRRSPLGRSSRSAMRAALNGPPGRVRVARVVLAPVTWQQVVQHVVDRDGSQELVVLVHHRQREDVIGGHAARDLGERVSGRQRGDCLLYTSDA